jgi:hypothetical protein
VEQVDKATMSNKTLPLYQLKSDAALSYDAYNRMYFLDAMYNPDGDEITETGMLSDFEPVEVSDTKPSAPGTLSVDINAIRSPTDDPVDRTPRNADTSEISYVPKTNTRVYSNPKSRYKTSSYARFKEAEQRRLAREAEERCQWESCHTFIRTHGIS